MNGSEQLLISPRSRKTISLTALIDVVFILLMFFMLTSTFTKWHSVELQTASAGKNEVQSSDQTQLIIMRETGGFSLLINGTDTAEQQFTSLPELADKVDIKKSTVLIPEEKVQVQAIMDAIAHLKTAGVNRVTLGNVL